MGLGGSPSLAGGRENERRDNWPSVVLALALAILLLALLAPRVGVLFSSQPPWIELAFWATLILVMNLVPVHAGERSFTLDTPFLLAVGLLYEPEAAALAGMIGGLDVRELRGQVTLARAFFNRAQIGLCVLASSATFHAVAQDIEPWGTAVIGTGAALMVFHVVNAVTVATYTTLRFGTAFSAALKSLTVGPASTFMTTYLGYGVLALVVAFLFRDVGAWSVAMFLLPLLVARQMLVRGEEALALTKALQQRERILERLFDRIAEERRDERLRISTGLHDDVLQSLIRVSQLGSFLVAEVEGNESAKRDAVELVAIGQEATEGLREVVNDLRRSPVGRGGLVPTLRTLASDLRLHWRIPVEVDAPSSVRAAPETQLVAYQVAREALTNSLKHSRPSKVTVKVSSNDDATLTVIVADDGEGFRLEEVDMFRHFGLGLMKERVALAKGRLEIRSSSTGTTLVAIFPSRL